MDDFVSVRDAVRARVGAFAAVGLFSAVINVLLLTSSFYMLQVYDRVLASRSIETLIVISAIALIAFIVMGMLDMLRGRILARIGSQVEQDLSPVAYTVALLRTAEGRGAAEANKVVRDVDQLRYFLGGGGPASFFDLVFMPLFLVGCFLLHPWLGWLALAGSLITAGFTWFSERRSVGLVSSATELSSQRTSFFETSRFSAEAALGMGMIGALRRRWSQMSDPMRAGHLAASDLQSVTGSTVKVFRMMFQSAVLGLGALLVIEGALSPGAMIAASIIGSRAMSPLEGVVAHWRGFTAARQAYARLQSSLLKGGPIQAMPLPAPTASLSVEAVSVASQRIETALLLDINFKVAAGQAIAIIGESGSGKSTLARTIVGIMPPSRGAVRLDGARLDQWDRERLGPYIGYLPQDLSFVDGTVSEIISRGRLPLEASQVIAAASAADLHEFILRLPKGYDTVIGPSGVTLSGGERQRLGLARALFGDPFLIVLDEPNANLDAPGDEALILAIRRVRERGGIVVIVTHRQSVLTAVDLVAVLVQGRLKLVGERDAVLYQLRGGQGSGPQPQIVDQAGSA